MPQKLNPTTKAVIALIRTLPNNEQKHIGKALNASKKKKKLSKKEKKTQEVLNSISAGLREIKEAKRTGKKVKTLDAFLKEF